MQGNIAAAEPIITKWDPDDPSSHSQFTSLFSQNPREARDFLRSVGKLQRTMHFFLTHNPSSEKLVRAQILMQTAMKRLQKEFYQTLAANREQQTPDSASACCSTTTARTSPSDDEDNVESADENQIVKKSISDVEEGSTATTSDLQAIADCMISSGYGKECVDVYKIVRRSIVDEGIYRLGFHPLSSKHLERMGWDALELKMKNWINATEFSIKTLFYGEQILCDHVFSSSKAITESCFADIVKEAAIHLVAFPEAVVKCSSKEPEKIFRFLDLYETIAELWPDIQSVFSYESTSAVRTQATSSLTNLGDVIRIILAKFESAMQKDSSKSPVPGGDLHPLTRYVMNYICLLCDYSEILSEIFQDFTTALPKENPLSAISSRFEWLLLVLLCKLDSKAKLYKDVGLSYLFLANNLQYVVSKVRRSNLHCLLGNEWLSNHESKVRQFAANYARIAWSKVASALPQNPTAHYLDLHAVKERFRQFNSAFEAAHQTQTEWVVTDRGLRDEIKFSLAKKIVALYRPFYAKYRALLRSDGSHSVRFAPEDLENYISGLFCGSGRSTTCSRLHQADTEMYI